MRQVREVRIVRQVKLVQKLRNNRELENQYVDVKFPATIKERYKMQELEALLWAADHHDFFITKYRWLLEWVQRNHPELLDKLRSLPTSLSKKREGDL